MSDGVPTIDLLGLPFARLTRDEALDEAERLYEREEPGWIAIENVHAVNIATEDRGHAEVLRRADLLLNDGKGVLLGGLMLGRRFPEDLNGNVFTPLLLERAAERGWPVYFLGAAPGVAERAAARLRTRYPKLDIVGVRDGYFGPNGSDEVAADIRSKSTGLLVVGMGMPIQERWLDDNLRATGARLGSTAGAFFDFEAGEIRRAPAWMNRLGLEWVHRLALEPKRMWRRYIVGNPLFVWRVLRQRLARSGSRSAA